MGKTVKLNEKSQSLIKHYLELSHYKDNPPLLDSAEVEVELLITWLSSDIPPSTQTSNTVKKELEFILASLRVELLHDMWTSMGIEQEALKKEEKNTSKTSRLKFYLLAISGALVAACEGFDSITTLLSVLSLPSVVTLLAGITFAALSVTVFVGFNLAQVSKNLGVKLADAPKILDLYALQMLEIKGLRKKIDSYQLATLSTQELEHLITLTQMLKKRFDSLAESCKQFDDSLKSPKVHIAKTLFGALSGLLFFGSGFFAGQSVAVFLLGLVMTGGVTAGFAPVVLFSLAVGFAAFGLYWYVEKVGLQQLISSWFGLDEEKIEGLCDKAALNAQSQKLCTLQEKLESTAELTRKLADLTQANTAIHWQDEFVFAADLNSSLSELAAGREVEGDTQSRIGMYNAVDEDLSTISTKQLSLAVECEKRSNASANLGEESTATVSESRYAFHYYQPPELEAVEKSQYPRSCSC